MTIPAASVNKSPPDVVVAVTEKGRLVASLRRLSLQPGLGISMMASPSRRHKEKDDQGQAANAHCYQGRQVKQGEKRQDQSGHSY